MMVNLSSPLVSVIIPVYNSELYLEACIESVIGQSYSTLEIIMMALQMIVLLLWRSMPSLMNVLLL